MHGKENNLASWVSYQRKKYRTGKLAIEQVKKLNGIGFDWGDGPKGSLDTNHWERMLDGLDTYQKNSGGSFRVPQG